MPLPRSTRAGHGAYDSADPFAAIARAADAEADSVIVEDFFRRTGRDLRAGQSSEIPSGLIR